MVPTTIRFVTRLVLRGAQEAQPEGEQDERDRIPDPAERAGDDGVDDVAHDAGHAPPLAGGDDDGEPDQGEAEPVAAVLRLEVAGAAADAADRSAGQVRDAHPGAADGAQRQRQPAGAGLRGAAGGRLAGGRAAAAARRLARRRHAPRGRARRRGGRARGHGRTVRESHLRLTRHTRPSASGRGRAAVGRRRRLRSRRLSSVLDTSRGPRYPREHGHECQRTAPACWPATLLRGGVLRMTTWPLAYAVGKRGPC